MAIENRQEFLDVLARIKGGRKARGQDYAKGTAAADIGKTVATSFANVASTITNSIETTGKKTHEGIKEVKKEIKEGTDDPETRRESARAQKLREIKEKSKGQKEDILLRKESFFGKGISGLLLGAKGLFTGLGFVAKIFTGLGGFLLKPFKWLAGGIGSTLGVALKAARVFFIGLAGIAALFAGLGIAKAVLTDKEFADLKLEIAAGVATLASKMVAGAISLWNSLAPESWKISQEDSEKYKTSTFVAVKNTIIDIIEFAEMLSAAFMGDKKGGTGFRGQMTKFDTAWKNFKKAFDDVIKIFTPEKGKTTSVLVETAQAVGSGLGKLLTFLTNLGTALLLTVAGKEVKVDDPDIMKGVNAIKNIWKFLKDIGGAFGTKFSQNWEGVETQFAAFTTAWDKVFTTIGKSSATPDKKTFIGIATWFADIITGTIEAMLAVGEGIAKLITDPGIQIAKMQVAVETFWNDITDTIGGFFSEVFSIKGMVRILEHLLGREIPFLSALAGQRDIEQQKERINKLTSDNLALEKKMEQARKVGAKADTNEGKYYAELAQQRFAALKRRNLQSIQRAKESIIDSAAMASAETIQDRLWNEVGFDVGAYETNKALYKRQHESFSKSISLGEFNSRELTPENIVKHFEEAIRLGSKATYHEDGWLQKLKLSPEAAGMLEAEGFHMSPEIMRRVFMTAQSNVNAMKVVEAKMAAMEKVVTAEIRAVRTVVTKEEAKKVLKRMGLDVSFLESGMPEVSLPAAQPPLTQLPADTGARLNTLYSYDPTGGGGFVKGTQIIDMSTTSQHLSTQQIIQIKPNGPRLNGDINIAGAGGNF